MILRLIKRLDYFIANIINKTDFLNKNIFSHDPSFFFSLRPFLMNLLI